MTEEVMISIVGEQMDIDENEKTELITFGRHFLKNGKHYILYDETQPEEQTPTSGTIKMTADKLEVIRKGSNQSHMVFEKGKEHVTSYQTMAGPMMMTMFTDDIRYTEEEDRIEAVVEYSFSMNEIFVSKCRAVVLVQSKDHAQISLLS